MPKAKDFEFTFTDRGWRCLGTKQNGTFWKGEYCLPPLASEEVNDLGEKVEDYLDTHQNTAEKMFKEEGGGYEGTTHLIQQISNALSGEGSVEGIRFKEEDGQKKGIVVSPKKGDQPEYTRSNSADQKSEKLIWHKECISDKMNDENFKNRSDVRNTFAQASKECAKENPH